jgi:hypothetical protein
MYVLGKRPCGQLGGCRYLRSTSGRERQPPPSNPTCCGTLRDTARHCANQCFEWPIRCLELRLGVCRQTLNSDSNNSRSIITLRVNNHRCPVTFLRSAHYCPLIDGNEDDHKGDNEHGPVTSRGGQTPEAPTIHIMIAGFF